MDSILNEGTDDDITGYQFLSSLLNQNAQDIIDALYNANPEPNVPRTDVGKAELQVDIEKWLGKLTPDEIRELHRNAKQSLLVVKQFAEVKKDILAGYEAAGIRASDGVEIGILGSATTGQKSNTNKKDKKHSFVHEGAGASDYDTVAFVNNEQFVEIVKKFGEKAIQNKTNVENKKQELSDRFRDIMNIPEKTELLKEWRIFNTKIKQEAKELTAERSLAAQQAGLEQPVDVNYAGGELSLLRGYFESGFIKENFMEFVFGAQPKLENREVTRSVINSEGENAKMGKIELSLTNSKKNAEKYKKGSVEYAENATQMITALLTISELIAALQDLVNNPTDVLTIARVSTAATGLAATVEELNAVLKKAESPLLFGKITLVLDGIYKSARSVLGAIDLDWNNATAWEITGCVVSMTDALITDAAAVALLIGKKAACAGLMGLSSAIVGVSQLVESIFGLNPHASTVDRIVQGTTGVLNLVGGGLIIANSLALIGATGGIIGGVCIVVAAAISLIYSAFSSPQSGFTMPIVRRITNEQLKKIKNNVRPIPSDKPIVPSGKPIQDNVSPIPSGKPIQDNTQAIPSGKPIVTSDKPIQNNVSPIPSGKPIQNNTKPIKSG